MAESPVMADLDLLGWAEAAEVLGVEKSRISRWRRLGVVLPDGERVSFPEPVLVLSAGPLWRGEDIRRLRDQLAG
jgi:Bacteriophage CII protein